ncbi:MAG: hypothetical protein EOP02_02950 [Proteobacteria bacterium]|nr:MAG: hypothetical protein EOP02_02950 [Pseudomonadota bacterium]
MKRAMDSTGTNYRPNSELNNQANVPPAGIAGNPHQGNVAPMVFAALPGIAAAPLLGQLNADNRQMGANAMPGWMPQATVPTWSGDFPAPPFLPRPGLVQQAQWGDPNAQHELGSTMRKFAQGTLEEGIMWLERAAAQNHVSAACDLGMMHEFGEGLDANSELAFKWYEKGAAQGHPTALVKVGEAYLKGIGVEKDRAKAYQWLAAAEAQGEQSSKTLLGYLYYKGAGVEQDFQKAMGLICAANFDDEKSITIDWQLGEDHLGKAYPDDINVLLPYLFSEVNLNEEVKCLAIEGPEVDDEGAIAIAATLGDNQRVKHLHLDACEFSEAGGQAIMQAVYSTVTPLKTIDLGGQTGLGAEQIIKMNQRLRQNPQIIELLHKYTENGVGFNSKPGLPGEAAYLLVRELILNDQTKLIPGSRGARYPTMEETARSVDELLNVFNIADTFRRIPG